MLRRALCAAPPVLGRPNTGAPSAVDQIRHASKATGGTCKYQKRPSPGARKPVQFKVVLGQAAQKDSVLRTQKYRWDGQLFSREPDFHAGHNVRMDPKNYTLYAETDGVVTVRKSVINPAYKWVDVEPDIQKVFRSRELRAAMGEQASPLVKGNASYAEEMKEADSPGWRHEVLRPVPLRQRVPDPNLISRGVSTKNKPLSRYVYE